MGRSFGLIEDHVKHTIAEIGYWPQGVQQFGIVRVRFYGYRLGHGLGNPFGADFAFPNGVLRVRAQAVIHASSLAGKWRKGPHQGGDEERRPRNSVPWIAVLPAPTP